MPQTVRALNNTPGTPFHSDMRTASFTVLGHTATRIETHTAALEYLQPVVEVTNEGTGQYALLELFSLPVVKFFITPSACTPEEAEAGERAWAAGSPALMV